MVPLDSCQFPQMVPSKIIFLLKEGNRVIDVFTNKKFSGQVPVKSFLALRSRCPICPESTTPYKKGSENQLLIRVTDLAKNKVFVFLQSIFKKCFQTTFFFPSVCVLARQRPLPPIK